MQALLLNGSPRGAASNTPATFPRLFAGVQAGRLRRFL